MRVRGKRRKKTAETFLQNALTKRQAARKVVLQLSVPYLWGYKTACSYEWFDKQLSKHSGTFVTVIKPGRRGNKYGACARACSLFKKMVNVAKETGSKKWTASEVNLLLYIAQFKRERRGGIQTLSASSWSLMGSLRTRGHLRCARRRRISQRLLGLIAAPRPHPRKTCFSVCSV